jgi:subtilase family serine protease
VQKYGAASPYVTAVGGVFNGEIGNDVLQAGAARTMRPAALAYIYIYDAYIT